MHMLEISQLQTLVAVAKSNSFSRAAENKLGVVLFNRLGKKAVLTSEGEKLHHLASTFITQLNNTVDEIKHDKDKMNGPIRIGTLTGIGKSWLGYEMLALSESFPELKVEVKFGFEDDLLKSFEGCHLDFLVLPESALSKCSGERIYLIQEKLSLVYPNDDKFKLEENVTLDSIACLPTILFESHDYLHAKWCKMALGGIPERVNVRLIINSHGKMLEAVHNGLGIAVIPTHVLNRSYYKDKIARLGSKFEVENDKFYLVYHKEGKEFLRIRETIERLVKNKKRLI
jgi:DNA-binding transcriptional LysR family regulator